MASSSEVYFYAAVGARVHIFSVDEAGVALNRAGEFELPAWVQYAWRHPSLPILYVVSSDGGPALGGRPGEVHHASALAIDPNSGLLSPLGLPVRLPARPIHCSVDGRGEYLLTAFNDPSGVSVHRLAPTGEIGAEVEQTDEIECGIYAHQVLTTPSNRTVIVAARGHDATADRAEDPGALYVFDFVAGRLGPVQRVAPGDGSGYGFGPRHLDFHPSGSWVAVSVERQDQLQVYRVGEDGRLSPSPLFTREALSRPDARKGPQMSSAVRAHANGRFVYQANITDRLRLGED